MPESQIAKNNSLVKLAFSIYSSPGAYALLVGSGVSRSAEILTGWEVMLDLIQRVGKINGTNKLDNPIQWYQEKFGKEPSYDTLLYELTSTPSERRALLSEYFEPKELDIEEGRKVPQTAHRAIASLVKAGYLKLIITTNFDRLIETALYDIGFHPYVISHESRIRSCPPPAHIQHSCIIFKIHGDYLDNELRNTPKELAAYPESMNIYLDRILDEFGLITCGWSGEYDFALVERLKARRSDAPYPTYVSYRGEKKPSIQELLKIPNTIPIEISDADDFFNQISANVISLGQTEEEPLSYELTIQRTKKFLSDSKYQIQLVDILQYESIILKEWIDSVASKFQIRNQNDYENYLQDCNEKVKKIIGIVSLISLYSTDYSKKLTEIIEYLGSIYIGELHSWSSPKRHWRYPTVLVFYAIGIAAVKGERFQNIKGLFFGGALQEYSYQTKIMESLQPGYILGDSKDYIIRDPRSFNIDTKFNYQVFTSLYPLVKSLFYNIEDYSTSFDIFELILSLSHFEQINPDLSEKELRYYKSRFVGGREFFSGEMPHSIKGFIEKGNMLKSEWPLFKDDFFLVQWVDYLNYMKDT